MIDLAIEMAARAHQGQVRKATDVPYISHPYAVGMMLARAGYPEELIITGILHDTVEDTYVTLDEIRETFGDKVASIVEGCSEPHKSASWEERKNHTLEYLRTASWEVRVVACADKLHNIRTIATAYERLGERVWERFKRGRSDQEWYYRGLVESLCSQVAMTGQVETSGHAGPLSFCRELKREVEALFSKAIADSEVDIADR